MTVDNIPKYEHIINQLLEKNIRFQTIFFLSN